LADGGKSVKLGASSILLSWKDVAGKVNDMVEMVVVLKRP
jgi:hypothetical protein